MADEVDAFLTQHGLGKYTEELKKCGLTSLSDIKDLSQNDIEELANEAKLGVLFKKKLVAACAAYQGGDFKEDEKKQEVNEALKTDAVCFKCKGNTFSHDNGHYRHDRSPNEKCSTCSTCKGCQGNGRIKGISQQCLGCNGYGWRHSNGHYKHDRDKEWKCSTCGDCKGCEGLGHISGEKTLVLCFQCQGHGWKHNNGHYKHDRDKEWKCSTCGDCKGCDGKGYLIAVDNAYFKECPQCKTHGFYHNNGNYRHDRNVDEKCSTCADCKGCTGKGYVMVGNDDKFELCGACKNLGWKHDNGNYRHDRDADQKCSTCSECKLCSGKGYSIQK